MKIVHNSLIIASPSLLKVMGNADGDGEYGNDSLAGVTNSVDIDIDDGRC